MVLAGMATPVLDCIHPSTRGLGKIGASSKSGLAIYANLSSEGFAEFRAVLSGPATAVSGMVDLAKRPGPSEVGYAATRRALELSAPEPLMATRSRYLWSKPEANYGANRRASHQTGWCKP